MKYINWYEYMKYPLENKISHTKEKPKDSIIWEDIITGTVFYLPKDLAQKISLKAIDYIKGFKDDVEKLYEYISGKFENTDIEYDVRLFPSMPYYKSNDSAVVHRIADQHIIRTGVLFSVLKDKYPKEEIRKYGLLKSIELHGGESLLDNIDKDISDLIEDIDSLLLGDTNKDLGKYSVDIIKGGAVKVKQYFLETNRIKDIRGASRILDKINREIIPDYIGSKYTPECIVYCGGGNVQAILPSGEGPVVAEEMERIYEKVALTAQSVASFNSYTLYQLSKEKYGQSMANLQEKVTERQMIKVDWRVNPDEGNIRYPYENYDYDKVLKKASSKEICSHCNMRTARYQLNHDDYFCLSCLHKNIEGGREGKSDFVRQFKEYCKNNSIEDIKERPVNTLDDISRAGDKEGFIGVIYGDGNNMGSVVQRIKSLCEIRYFSERTESATFEVVYKSLGDTLRNTGFEIIAIGGDDIFMIVPGDKAISLSKEIGELFDQRFKNLSKDQNNITMSLGVTISHHNTPIQYLFDLSQQLLKNAKKKARNITSGTVDIIAMENDSLMGSSLKTLRQELIRKEEGIGGNKSLNLTMRPYNWDELEGIIDVVRDLKDKKLRSRVYRFREASMNMNIQESNLLYVYELSKLKHRKIIIESLSKLTETFNINSGNTNQMMMNLYDENNYTMYSPWLDITEFWDYIPQQRGAE